MNKTDFDKYHAVLNSFGGKQRKNRKCMDGHMEYWYLPEDVDANEVSLKLDELNSTFNKIELTREESGLNSNLKVYYEYKLNS